MKRGSFLKKIGIGMAAIAVAPMMMAEAIKPKQKWTHVTINPVGETGPDIFEVYTGGYYDRTLTKDEIQMFYNMIFEQADFEHLITRIPVKPVHFWINGKQVMMNGKRI